MEKQIVLYEHFNSDLNPIKIAIADDHKMIREFLVNTIKAMNGFSVVLSVANGKELIQGIGSLNQLPDICIIDINMPVMNGYDTQLVIKTTWPEIKSLAISIYDDSHCVIRMLQNGANGFISKQSTPEIIQEALLQIFYKGSYYNQIPTDILSETVILPELSEKEKEYTFLVCNGQSNEEIAQKMSVSIRSLQYYRDAVYKKLNIKSRAELIFYARRTGIVFMR